MIRKIEITLLLSLSLLLGCHLQVPTEGNYPTWYTDVYLPLGTYSQTGRELLSRDSLIADYPVLLNSDSLYVYRDSVLLDTMEVGDELKVDDVHKSFSFSVDQVTLASQGMQTAFYPTSVEMSDVSRSITNKVGLIHLDDTAPTSSDMFSFREIMPEALVNSMETTLQAAGGSANFPNIPEHDLQSTERPFTFESFQFIVLNNGMLDLSVVNDMFIPLGAPIHVSLRYMDDTEFASTTFNTPIPVNGSGTQIIDLGGDSLAQIIKVQISGHSNGTDSPVTLESSDLDRGFHVEIGSREMYARKANARLPEQMISDEDSMAIESSDDQINEAQIESGSLSLNIDNRLGIAGQLTIRVPALDENGSAFERGPFPVPAMQSTHKTFSLSNTNLTFDAASQAVDYEFDFATENTGNQFETITSEDSVAVNVSFNNLALASVDGVLSETELRESDSFPLETENTITSAVVESGELSLDVQNNVGGSYQMRLALQNLFDSKNSPDTVISNIDLQPGANQVSIPLANKEIRLSDDDQNFHYAVDLVNEVGQYQYDLNDSIIVDMNMSSIVLSEATGYFTRDVMSIEDTLQINQENRLQKAVVDSGSMSIHILNHIGVNAGVHLQFAELYKSGVTLDTTLQITDNPFESTHEIPLKGYTIRMPLDNQAIHYSARTSMADDSLMTLTFGDSIEIEVDLAGITFAEVTAEVAPKTVPLDPYEYQVQDLPAELDRIKIPHVDMQLDFQSNVELPLFVNLRITSFSSSGDSVSVSLDHWNVTDSSTIHVPNADRLLDIVPTRIVASGDAIVGEAGVVGVITPNQFVTGKLSIAIPAEFEITADAVFEAEPYRIEEPAISEIQLMESVESITLFADYTNGFNFGGRIHLNASGDSLALKQNVAGGDTVIALPEITIPGSSSDLDSLELKRSTYSLFSDSLYIRPQLQLLPSTPSGGEVSRFRSTDSLRARMYVRIRYLNDLNPKD